MTFRFVSRKQHKKALEECEFWEGFWRRRAQERECELKLLQRELARTENQLLEMERSAQGLD